MTDDWQPIETAPKSTDNCVAIPILGFCPGEYNGDYGSDDRIRIIWWEPGYRRWYDDRDIKGSPSPPTHWMPLPPPPDGFARPHTAPEARDDEETHTPG